MATIYEKVGERIKKLRRDAGLSQEQLATESKLDLTSISEIESGLRNPSLKTLYKISLALKGNIKDLID